MRRREEEKEEAGWMDEGVGRRSRMRRRRRRRRRKQSRMRKEEQEEEGEQKGQRSIECLFGASSDIYWALLGGILGRLRGLLTVLEGSWSS